MKKEKIYLIIVFTIFIITLLIWGFGTIKIKDNTIYLYDEIINSNKPISDYKKNNDKGLYFTDNETIDGEDGKKIYYFKGNVDNNWVSLGNTKWRIVRTTSENGIKLIYSGSDTDESVFIGKARFNNTNNFIYLSGYTYNLNGYFGTQTNSNIKSSIETWYLNNLKNEEKYISTNAVYCSDKSKEIKQDSIFRVVFPSQKKLDDIENLTTYNCSNTNYGKYSVNGDSGNGFLSYPIGLLSIDEIAKSYIIVDGNNESYLNTNVIDDIWWTMTPYGSKYDNLAANRKANFTGVYGVNGKGNINEYDVINEFYMRPSIALKACVTYVHGSGTKKDPYVISNENC